LSALSSRWLYLVCGIFCVNFITNIALAAGGARSAISLLFIFIELAIAGPLGVATLFFTYRGWAESAGRDKTIARVGMLLLLIFSLVMCFVFGGNVNGLSGLGASSVFEAASTE
jgi:hypothetical protein